MLPRHARQLVERRLREFPVVALLGSRQSGKTTLAKELVRSSRRDDGARSGGGHYLDLELPSDVAKLQDAEAYLSRHENRLVVLDEIQRRPDLFPVLRGLIDARRRKGRFLVLGSSSPDLLRQSSESLAGRIAFVELAPLSLSEIAAVKRRGLGWERLWERGGYPDSVLARSRAASLAWRDSFLRTHLEHDLPALGIRVPGSQLRRFWQMLAHWHGEIWNASAFARNFDVTAPTVRHYLDILTDTFVVRQLRPLHVNLRKRLAKSPKVYVRDSGLLHSLLGIQDVEGLYGHPKLGSSFEGFALEQIVPGLPADVDVTFFRTHTGDGLDLVLTVSSRRRLAIEIKFSSAPGISAGTLRAIDDVGATNSFVVTSSSDRFPLAKGIEAIALSEFVGDVLPRLIPRR